MFLGTVKESSDLLQLIIEVEATRSKISKLKDFFMLLIYITNVNLITLDLILVFL